jgi:hypothetical protein
MTNDDGGVFSLDWNHMPKIKLQAGNYLERTDGAVFVRLDTSTLYFSHGRLIAIITGDIIYRSAGLNDGIIYKRIRAAVQRQPGVKKTRMISDDELQAMVESLIMLTASKLVREKVGLEA